MADQQERILVVESDPIVSDLIARQALGSQGFDVKVVEDASSAIQQALVFNPDIVIANLDLPGLSGKDLLAAMASQNISIPVIMIAAKGEEKDVIQSFRLGASDYVSSPVRETEVVSAVERALKTVRARKERQRLSRQLESTNKELKKRVNELTTIFSVGKAVTSITDQKELYDKIIDAGVKITTADYGWLLVYDDRSKQYLLMAHRNLPKSLTANMGKPWDDGISSLVALSGESFSIHGEAIQRFQIASLGRSALVAPVKLKTQTFALMVVMRKADNEFGPSDTAMLEAVSDYASISMANVHLFRALDERAASLQAAVEKARSREKVKDDVIKNINQKMEEPLGATKQQIDKLVAGDLGQFSYEQLDALEQAQHHLDKVVEVANLMADIDRYATPQDPRKLNLSDLANQAIGRWSNPAGQANLQLSLDTPNEPLMVKADSYQISQVFDGLLSNAVKFSPKGGEIVIQLALLKGGLAHVSVQDPGIGISKKDQARVFDYFFKASTRPVKEPDIPGISLALVQEVITSHGGQVGVESKSQTGSTFHFTLPLAK